MTKTLKHTKAPWEDNGNGLIFGQCSGEDDEAPFVADVCDNPNAYTEQEQANARLITTAPALLEALEYLADEADFDCPAEYRSRYFREALENARDIIAKTKAA
jgi:hypothetical protein